MPVIPKNLPKAKVRIEDFTTKDGKVDFEKFWKLPDDYIGAIIGDAINTLRRDIAQYKFTEESQQAANLLEAIDKQVPELGLSSYVTLHKARVTSDGTYLSKDLLDSLKEYDPETFYAYLDNAGWEALTTSKDFDFKAYKAENKPESVEPSAGVLTDKPLNNASPAETSSGALTNQPPELPKKETVIREPIDNAELVELANKGPERTYKNRVGNTTLKPEDTPIFLTKEGGSLPKEGVVVGPETSKPGVDTPLAEENSAAASSPEAIHEAMADAVAKDKSIPKEDTVVVPPEAAAEEAAKGTADAKAVTEGTEAKAVEKAEDKATPETAEKGALTGEPKGFLSKIGGHFKRNLGKYLLGGIGIGATSGIVDDLASDNSKIKTPFTGSDVIVETNNPSVTQPRVKSLDQREGAYMPERLLRFTTDEEYTPGKIPSHIPQDNLPTIKESSGSKKIKSQPQVVNAPVPVNNATADYVRAAYRSYIPSDAGRAYQKAIYGDPLELDRMRLQQQQQKWRDFVMRSGQSPAELVQRGLMPYDALQYI